MSLLREKEKSFHANQRLSKLINKIFSGFFATIVLSSHILPLSIIAQGEDTKESYTFVPSIKLDTKDRNVITSVKPNIKFVLGESLVNKEARIKTEEESRTRAAEQKRIEEEKRQTVSRELRVYSVEDFNSLYESAGARYDVNPKLLQAIHIVETGASGSTTRSSYAGATGPMQFLPSTWKRHGVDGDGDDKADISNVADAIFAAAKYLRSCGYPDVKKALWGYNPSSSYYNKVMGIALKLGM